MTGEKYNHKIDTPIHCCDKFTEHYCEKGFFPMPDTEKVNLCLALWDKTNSEIVTVNAEIKYCPFCGKEIEYKTIFYN